MKYLKLFRESSSAFFQNYKNDYYRSIRLTEYYTEINNIIDIRPSIRKAVGDIFTFNLIHITDDIRENTKGINIFFDMSNSQKFDNYSLECVVYELPDEYYLVIKRQMNRGELHDEYYICDQTDGLIEFLKEEFKSHLK